MFGVHDQQFKCIKTTIPAMQFASNDNTSQEICGEKSSKWYRKIQRGKSWILLFHSELGPLNFKRIYNCSIWINFRSTFCATMNFWAKTIRSSSYILHDGGSVIPLSGYNFDRGLSFNTSPIPQFYQPIFILNWYLSENVQMCANRMMMNKYRDTSNF